MTAKSNATSNRTTSAPPSTGYGFGTFKGVYTPNLLTILGVIMYLRFGRMLVTLTLARSS